ncbi:hypothetical protein CK203_113278 [Vitis vinifera]|uniref:Small G protein signalling modulator 1/2 Rab-binding domain-containing protein n=1 Tax=Vitis vinifera TaxID=29760 RepID=A0A438EIF4_VITVI|nr:hypothetical protein CK203_113278 [Vitis vinifera]
MQEAELHDLSDDADYAASQLQGSASFSRSGSSKRSSSSESDGAEIVYSKDNVTIHPTQYASERISGRLRLIKQGSSLFMTWIPYKGQRSNPRLSEKDKSLYTIRAVPFTDVRSIRRHTPTLGWQYVIVVLSSGLAFPPLYFYNGGVREFLATIKQHAFLVRLSLELACLMPSLLHAYLSPTLPDIKSLAFDILRSADDANVFLVNDFQDPLQVRIVLIYFFGEASSLNLEITPRMYSKKSIKGRSLFGAISGATSHSFYNLDGKEVGNVTQLLFGVKLLLILSCFCGLPSDSVQLAALNSPGTYTK